MAACTLREVKSIRDTIRYYEDESLNYFDGCKTNASAESLNSKTKCFRSLVNNVCYGEIIYKPTYIPYLLAELI